MPCAIILLSTMCGFAQFSELKTNVDRLTEAMEPEVIEWRHHLHEFPELSNREFKTSAYIEAHLRSLGLEVRTEVAHTGIVAVLRGGRPGPVVALRADMDGLPVMERVDLPFASKEKGEYNGEIVDVMHAWFGKLAVQDKGERCYGYVPIGETDLRSVSLDDASRAEGIHDGLYAIHVAARVGIFLRKALSNSLAAQSPGAEVGQDKLFDDLN